ncbi:hypothetical protein PFLmoz3_05967 [Pseudomonas fluorescens]|uniref:Uncharacterized protein n=2 Tax=Pseudomonas fluorescens TaxID=294 RepID=A0A109LB16_PSEFL|nr:hypothetical protein PFLmoz3_05967 [Pseudomonas fluorescens]
MQPIQFFAARAEDGALLPNASVDVFAHGSQERAILFSDSAGTVPLENPFLADANARVFFYSTTDRIDIRISRYGYVAPMLLDISTMDVATAVEQVRHEIDQVLVEAKLKFDQLLMNSGYESEFLTYAAGAVIQRPRQLVQRSGELYSITNQEDLPLTLTGTWATDSPKLRAVGDMALRQELANPVDSRKGSAGVGRVYRQVDTIAELKSLSRFGSPYAEVLEYSSGAGVINSRYHLDRADITTAGNDFTVVVADDGGRWRLKHADAYTLKMAGGKEDGVTDDADAWDRLLAVSQGKQVVWDARSMSSRPIVIPVNKLRLEARTPDAAIMAMDGTNFEYTLSAVGKSRLEFKGFTADSNKAGRESVLTTRTVSVSLVNCTDCELTQVRGIGAIGFGGLPGIGISTAGGGLRVNTTNCTAMNCGSPGKAGDGFFCSSSQSVNKGNVSINCLDTGHVLESCSYSGLVGCVSMQCGVIAAITNATSTNKYGNYINGLTGEDWSADVTGGVQIGVFGAGDLVDTKVEALSMVGINSFIGPGVNVRRTGAGRVDGLDLDVSIRNSTKQGILVDSARRVNIKATVTNPANACIQFQGDCTGCQVLPGTNLSGGSFGAIALGTSEVFMHGIRAISTGSYGVYAFGTSSVTSMMNHVTGTTAGREGKDAGATLNRISLVEGFLSLDSIVSGAPLSGVSSKFTIVNRTGNTAGVVGVSAT